METTTPARGRPRGRPRKDRSKSEALNITLHRSEFPHVEELIYAKNPQELYDRFGLDLPRDLFWSKSSLKGLSQRVGAILETIARGELKKRRQDADKE